MDVSTMLWAVIVMLLGIIGFYIARDYKKQDDTHKTQEQTNKELFRLFNALNESLISLNGTLKLMEDRHNELKDQYEKHKIECRFPRVKTG